MNPPQSETDKRRIARSRTLKWPQTSSKTGRNWAIGPTSRPWRSSKKAIRMGGLVPNRAKQGKSDFRWVVKRQAQVAKRQAKVVKRQARCRLVASLRVAIMRAA